MSDARKTARTWNWRHLPVPIKVCMSIKTASALLCVHSFRASPFPLHSCSHMITYFPHLYIYQFSVLISIIRLNVFLFYPLFSIFILSHCSRLCHSDSDQQWFPAHWFVGFGGVNCVILIILLWHGSRGRGWWEKRHTNRGNSDKAVLMSCGQCFFKSIFSMADNSGHSSGKKARWL